MKITPTTEQEIQKRAADRLAALLLPDGEYAFTVYDSQEVASKSEKNRGKLMFEIKLLVHGPDKDFQITDYFADWFSEHKLRHFAETTAQIEAYNTGSFDGAKGAFKDKTGYLKIATEKARGNFGPKNVVKDYVVKEKKSDSESDDSSIPF